MENNRAQSSNTTMGTVGQVIGRFIVAAIILGITAFFTPNFTINNWWSLGVAAIVLSVMDYLIEIGRAHV